jgi:SAM-dependent methyltransferase
MLGALVTAGLGSPALAQGMDHHHRFEDPKQWADRFEDPARDAWQLPDSVLAALVTRKDLVVGDIGSATGYFPVRFARALPEGQVFGADLEPGMVTWLNDRARREGIPNLVSVLATPDDPHFPRRPDLVFVCNTYHHIEDRSAYFRRLHGQTTAGARLAIVDYRPESEHGPAVKLAPEVVEGELSKAGWKLETRHGFLPEQYFLVFRAAPTP